MAEDVVFGPKPCLKCGRTHYRGACPEPRRAAATVIAHPTLESARERSAFRQGFEAGMKAARLQARKNDPEWKELQHWALEQADRAAAAEATLAAMDAGASDHD